MEGSKHGGQSTIAYGRYVPLLWGRRCFPAVGCRPHAVRMNLGCLYGTKKKPKITAKAACSSASLELPLFKKTRLFEARKPLNWVRQVLPGARRKPRLRHSTRSVTRRRARGNRAPVLDSLRLQQFAYVHDDVDDVANEYRPRHFFVREGRYV